MEQIDENENIVHRTEEPESTSTLTVSDAFTRLVWIDPNSPTLQRKGVTEDRPEEVDHGDVDDEEEDGGDAGKDSDEEKGDSHEMEMEHDEEDARTAYEQENREESEGKLTNLGLSKQLTLSFSLKWSGVLLSAAIQLSNFSNATWMLSF